MSSEPVAGVFHLGPASSVPRGVGARVGRFEIVRQIGSGGSADVYEAEHLDLGRRVALKIVRWNEDDSEAMLARFRREARISGGLRHPNIADVFDTGHTEDGMPYLAMELLCGQPLDVWIRRGPMPFESAIEIAAQLSDALAAVHELGVVHRDVKPHNVILHRGDDGALGVKLIDFGISKPAVAAPLERMVTRHGLVVGTPHYMAPELVAGAMPTPGHDVYAAGVLLYECVAGRAPFEGPDLRSVVVAILADAAPPVTAWRPDCPAPLAALIARAIARRPEDRFVDATAMRDALAAVASELGLPTGPAALGAPRPDATPTGRITGVHRRSLSRATPEPTPRAEPVVVRPPVSAPPVARTEPTPMDTSGAELLRRSQRRSMARIGLAALAFVLCIALSVATWLCVGGPHVIGVLP